MRFFGRLRSTLHRLRERLIGVGHFERNVTHPVAMLSDVFGGSVVRRHGRRQNKVGLALTHGIRSSFPVAGFQSTVSDLRKSKCLAVEERGLPGIADKKFNVV